MSIMDAAAMRLRDAYNLRNPPVPLANNPMGRPPGGYDMAGALDGLQMYSDRAPVSHIPEVASMMPLPMHPDTSGIRAPIHPDMGGLRDIPTMGNASGMGNFGGNSFANISPQGALMRQRSPKFNLQSAAKKRLNRNGQ